ncbi:hypothetical protein [Bradyrhizobium sp.]|jgi:hypothetical protein|uniref:hypothetical protein n=1 Tax=Bradyrhizobium sp. TaxID=376 RepID=UPI003C72CCAB
MSSLEQRRAIVTTEGHGTPTAQGEIRQGLLFRQAVLIAAMVQAMTAWVYALGWVAIKLI